MKCFISKICGILKRDFGTQNLKEIFQFRARILLGTSMLLIVTFVMRHGLTGEALLDLLMLLELHCLAENICITTMTMYKDFFARLKLPITLVYYCSYCNNYFGTKKTEICNICKKSDLRSLISSPVGQQLESILASKYLHSIHSEELLQLISFLFFSFL